MDLYAKRKWGTLADLFTLTVLALTLAAAQQSSSLVITGQQGQAKVIQIQGRNYVEVEALARLANGSVSFNGNQIVLTLQGSNGNAPASASPPGFSKDFLAAGIEAMAQIREWHTALKTAIERGVPLEDGWLGNYRMQAQQSLRLASVAINTDSDKNAYPFMVNEYNNMKNLADKYLQMTKNMTYIDPNSLQSDPLDQKLIACGRSLASMVNHNQFVDDGSCQ